MKAAPVLSLLLLASAAAAAEPERRAGPKPAPGINVNAWTTGRILILKDSDGAYSSAQASGTAIEGGGHSIAYGGVRPDPKAGLKQSAPNKALGGGSGGGAAGGVTPGGVTPSSAAPVFSTLVPPNATIGWHSEQSLTGQNFQPGAFMRLSGPAASDRRATTVSAERLTATGTFEAALPPGQYQAKVVNPDGAVSAQGLALTLAAARTVPVGQALSRTTPQLPPGGYDFFQVRDQFSAANSVRFSIGDPPPANMRLMWKEGCTLPTYEDFLAAWDARASSNGVVRNGARLRIVAAAHLQNFGAGGVCAGFLVYNAGSSPAGYTFTSTRQGGAPPPGGNCGWVRSGSDFGPFPPAPATPCTTSNAGTVVPITGTWSVYTCTCS